MTPPPSAKTAPSRAMPWAARKSHARASSPADLAVSPSAAVTSTGMRLASSATNAGWAAATPGEVKAAQRWPAASRRSATAKAS